ncbi:Zn-dependent peptidase M16-like protein [Phanerochaete sordida]|uniref:Zn-dependent peptidase M16-like protein n=1 Tax=Phanerochaete sordida TaxID=48140 RepID=A0A9P3G3K0_9APHY|nr:Zn-dependent peptidase M16-like protein [Phanerochaete sordida]
MTAANGTNTYGNFDLVTRAKLDYADILVSKWKSRVTGLSVVHLDYNAPIVHGYFVIGTEIFNDSGCPHTLEHLVFMGSEKYPYKGIIDHLANRGFSNGTNAWTDTDHTAYTVSTAGEQGFLQLLPIYVDHILYPTLTKAGFVTEVHHVNGKGEDSGVVYSEMQGRENTSGDLMALRMQQLSFPSGSAYRSETGGLMKALRELTVEQIREYHGSYYVPHNLTLIVAGKLASGTNTLLDVVQNQIEPSLIAHGQNHGPRPKGWKKPFLETPSANRPPFTETIRDTVEFPEQDESVGEVQISWQGPAPTDFQENKAIDILGIYLTSSSTAPLNKEFVEIESPLCTYVYFEERDYATRNGLYVYAGSVPAEHLETFDEKLQNSLKRIAQEGFDMKRMAMVIDRDERQLRSKVESSKGDTFSGTVITDFLYGAENGTTLGPSLDEISRYDVIRAWKNEDWVKLLKKYYIDPHRVVLVGKPSAAMAKRLEEEEKVRITKQKERLGAEGLKRAEAELESAKAEHDRPIPTEILTSFPVPSVKSIAWIPVQSLQEVGKGEGRRKTVEQRGNADVSRHVEADGSPLPFFIQYDHVESDFVTISAYFSLADVPDELRPHIFIYLSSFFSLPVTRHNGEQLSHEEVVNRLDNDTVSYDIGLGSNGRFMETIRVAIRVQTAQYESAVAWLKDLLYGSKFDKERLAVTIAKTLQSLPELKRDGNTVLSSVCSEILYNSSSTSRFSGVLPQAEFVPKLSQELQDSPDAVIAKFEQIRQKLLQPKGARFAVSGNILALAQPRTAWAKYFNSSLKESPLEPIRRASHTLNEIGKNPSKKAVIVSLPTIESSFVSHYAKGIESHSHPQYPALRVAGEILNATESYLWRYIRGSGLAYGAYVNLDMEAGLVGFTLYRSSNSVEAFNQAKSVIEGLVKGTIALDETGLDAAKSSIVYSVTRGVSTPGRAGLVSFMNQALEGVSQNHNIELLEKYAKVTKEDVLKALETYFLPLFDSSSSVAVVVTAPSKAESTGEDLKKLGFKVEQRSIHIDPEEDGELSDSDSEGSDSDAMSTDSR